MKQKKYLNNKRERSFNTSKNIFKSFEYAFSGITYCLRYTRNFKIQIFFAILSLIFALFLNFKNNEFIILIATIFLVLILELLNTAIESLVDLVVETKYDKLAKISKDCSAASVLLASVNSIFVAAYLFFPKIKIIISNFK